MSFFDNFSFSGLGGVLAAGSVLQAGASLVSGFRARGESRERAELRRLDSQRQARDRARQVQAVRDNQIARFTAGGIAIEGSPALIIDETETIGRADVDDILEFGSRAADLERREGDNAFFGGLAGFAGGLLGGASQNALLKRRGVLT